MLPELTTNEKGAIAEAAIALAAVKVGIGVSRPLADERYDLIFDLRPGLARVQCKTALLRGDIVLVSCRTCRRAPEGFVRGSYTRAEIDAFAAYCRDLERCFYLPIERFDARSTIQLRLSPARNNQRKGVNWADDFDFARVQWNRLTGP